MIYVLRCYVVLPLFLTVLVGVISCAKQGTDDPGVRALARWNALIGDDWQRAYSFESAGYRESHSLRQFIQTFGGAVKWQSVQLVRVESVRSGVSTVILGIDSTYENMPVRTEISERWVLDEGEWWHIND